MPTLNHGQIILSILIWDGTLGLYKLSGNLAVFLARRMYENYLLNPKAIAEVANGIAGFRPKPLTPDEVREAIEAKLKDPSYF
jgi:hypothetical protein